MVDFNDKSVQLNPRNILKVKKWDGNDDDRSLIDLALLLKGQWMSATGVILGSLRSLWLLSEFSLTFGEVICIDQDHIGYKVNFLENEWNHASPPRPPPPTHTQTYTRVYCKFIVTV